VAREVDDSAQTPFAIVTRFVADRGVADAACAGMDDLAAAH
jgi:hypothetical protein